MDISTINHVDTLVEYVIAFMRLQMIIANFKTPDLSAFNRRLLHDMERRIAINFGKSLERSSESDTDQLLLIIRYKSLTLKEDYTVTQIFNAINDIASINSEEYKLEVMRHEVFQKNRRKFCNN